MAGYINSIVVKTDFTYFSPLYFAITEDCNWQFYNPPIWFLISLFDVYIIYMIIYKISNYLDKYNTLLKITLAIFVGYCGIRCNRLCINLPIFIDSSLTAFPFFILGHLIMSKTKILKNNHNTYTYLTISAILICIALFTAKGYIEYYRNNFKTSVFHTYIPGILGVIGMLMFSKVIGSIPIITKIGRYSIVYLGTHYLFVRDLKSFFELSISHQHNICIDLLTFFSTVLLSMVSCWFLLRTVPYLVAQKDFVYFENINNHEKDTRPPK